MPTDNEKYSTAPIESYINGDNYSTYSTYEKEVNRDSSSWYYYIEYPKIISFSSLAKEIKIDINFKKLEKKIKTYNSNVRYNIDPLTHPQYESLYL